MEKRALNLKERIRITAEKFREKIKSKEVLVISHFDTDGITSAAIMSKALKRIDANFSLKIIKSLEKEFIFTLPKDKLIIFLDLASGNIDCIKKSGLDVLILDHHEVSEEVSGIEIINPELNGKEKLSSSEITYLFCRALDEENKSSAKLAVLGMIGDQLEKEIDILNEEIVNDSEIKRRLGLMIYPSTRPLNRVLEFSSNPYIPGVTGNYEGVMELLRESGLKPSVHGKYKTLIELDENEMKNLATAIILRNPLMKGKEFIGDIFLIKMFGKLEDAREMSAMINACSRIDRTDISLQFCLEMPNSKKQAETLYAKYKQALISGLNTVTELNKITGKKFVIINAKDKIKDTIIGTIASILSYSSLYEEGTIIITMAYYGKMIKVSARNSGKNNRNLRELLKEVVDETDGEVGGHKVAAGCLIHQSKEEQFISLLKRNLEVEVVKIQNINS